MRSLVRDGARTLPIHANCSKAPQSSAAGKPMAPVSPVRVLRTLANRQRHRLAIIPLDFVQYPPWQGTARRRKPSSPSHCGTGFQPVNPTATATTRFSGPNDPNPAPKFAGLFPLSRTAMPPLGGARFLFGWRRSSAAFSARARQAEEKGRQEMSMVSPEFGIPGIPDLPEAVARAANVRRTPVPSRRVAGFSHGSQTSVA